MKQFLFLFTLTFTLTSWTPMAMAEKFYFYKEAGKQLPKGQDYDSSRILGAEKGIPGGFQIHFSLPKQYWRGKRNEVDLSFHAGVKQATDDSSTYLFSVEDLAIRGEDGKPYPLRVDPDPNALTEAGAAKLPPYRVKVIRQNQAMDGRIKSQYPIEVAKGDKSADTHLIFNISNFPKQLYLDYRFRVRKAEEEKPHMIEGTISLERAAYNVSLWKKIRY